VMSDRTPQQIADQLNSLRAQSVSIVEGTIAGAANPGGSITFTYINPIDKQPYTATGTAWNQCVPSKVSALKQTDGTWIVVGQHEAAIVREAVHTDRRARPKPETGDKIKVLYSVIEGDQKVFYLWGDRPRPKRLTSVPQNATIVGANLDNCGDGDRYIFSLSFRQASLTYRYNFDQGISHFQSFGNQAWEVVREHLTPPYLNQFNENDSNASDYYYPLGHGFWIAHDGGSISQNPNPVIRRQPHSSRIYGGIVVDYPGSMSLTTSPVLYYYENGAGVYFDDLHLIQYAFVKPILPSVTRDVSGTLTVTSIDHQITREDLLTLLTVGKNASSALYHTQTIFTYYNPDVPPNIPDTIRFVTSDNSEIILGADGSTDPYFNNATSLIFGSLLYEIWDACLYSANLVGSRLFSLLPPGATYAGSAPSSGDNSVSQWSVDIYNLGVNCTKSTIKAKVTYKPTTDKTFYNASYHP